MKHKRNTEAVVIFAKKKKEETAEDDIGSDPKNFTNSTGFSNNYIYTMHGNHFPFTTCGTIL
ncbi:hypothetical protein [Neobacillus sp. FSL H8-0543]|uniref:hypothetical protein n=1 Tax=Neobacillus sp. FSL H8-0543 TaxID=2954672 RepID=UPI00315900F7